MSPLALADLPVEVQDSAARHAAWYAARNLRDGRPRRPPRWTLAGIARQSARVYLALGIAAGLQRGDLDADRLRARLDAERRRSAELALAADAGRELARAQSKVTEFSALLLSDPVYAGADTEAIPTQRGATP